MTNSTNQVPAPAHPAPAPTALSPSPVIATTTMRFAITPGQTQDNILKLNDKNGIMAYHAAIIPLLVPFDSESKEKSHF